MKREAATAWTCACANPDVEYGQCTPAKPFRSLKRKETAEHEREHSALIERRNNLMEMVVTIQSVIGPELRIGTWDDWKGILEATIAFSKFVHEHQGIYHWPFFISGASDNLEQAVRKLVWCQTIKGSAVEDCRRIGAVYQTLDALFGDIKRRGERKQFPKRSFNTRMFTAKKLVDAITREAMLIELKFPNVAGLKEVGEALRVCNKQMTSELRQFHKELPGKE